MAKIKVNKIEAARRQINAAVRIFFRNEDPVAIHTLAMAAFRVLQDLAAKRDDSYMNTLVKTMLKPGMEKEFWKAIHTPANFFKHADKDADGVLDNVEEEINEHVLFIDGLFYQDLGNQLTSEMQALQAWYIAIHPEYISDDAPRSFKEHFIQRGAFARNKGRQEQLEMGSQLLELVYGQHRKV